jgi:hypothetical protein
MTSILQTQYIEIRSTLVKLKARYEKRKTENSVLQTQLSAFRKLVTQQCILIKEGREEVQVGVAEILRLERVLEYYREREEECERKEREWMNEVESEEEEVVEDSGVGSSQSAP